MSDDATTKQIEYLMSLFGMVKKEGENHPTLNADENQINLYKQNMIQLLEYCKSTGLNDISIVEYFGGSSIPVFVCYAYNP